MEERGGEGRYRRGEEDGGASRRGSARVRCEGSRDN